MSKRSFSEAKARLAVSGGTVRLDIARGRPRHKHDQDAGGDSEVLSAKATLRREVWDRMEQTGVAQFPGAHERIPNFVGARTAAERLASLAEWQRARTIKANPDSPQWPVRELALLQNKLLYMAFPRLGDRCPFFCLDPKIVFRPTQPGQVVNRGETARRVTTIKHALQTARRVSLSSMHAVDLVVAGSVAASADGRRLGKGGGFSDLEFALACAAGLIDEATTIVTTVHDHQVLPEGLIPVVEHDVAVDIIVTPTQVIRCQRHPSAKSTSGSAAVAGGDTSPRAQIRWNELTEEKIRSIPLLAEYRRKKNDR